jgi:hypothetical protein
MFAQSETIGALAAALDRAKGRVWSPLPGASQYLVSDSGEVLSMVRHPRILKPIRAGNYQAVQVRHDDGRVFKRYTHRAVLEAFCGAAPTGTEARHLDGDRTNNTAENLAWGSRIENHADKRRHGTTARGVLNPQAKLTPTLVAEMRRLRAAGGWTYKQIGRRFGVSTMTALRAVKGESWT